MWRRKIAWFCLKVWNYKTNLYWKSKKGENKTIKTVGIQNNLKYEHWFVGNDCEEWGDARKDQSQKKNVSRHFTRIIKFLQK